MVFKYDGLICRFVSKSLWCPDRLSMQSCDKQLNQRCTAKVCVCVCVVEHVALRCVRHEWQRCLVCCVNWRFNLTDSPVTRVKCWQLTFLLTTDWYVYVIDYISYWHFQKKCHSSCTLHFTDLSKPVTTVWDCVSTFVCPTPLAISKETIVSRFLTRPWSNCVFSDQNRYSKPRHHLFQTKWFLSLNLTRSQGQCCHNIQLKAEHKER